MSETAIPLERSSPLRTVALAVLVGFSLLYGLAAIVATYGTFNNTWDEPAHIAAGVELLDRGTYETEPKHPPIARLAVGLGPWLLGATSDPDNIGAYFSEGRRILYETGEYRQILTAARIGNIPFFLLTLLATWLLARRLFGAEVAACAVFFTATTPVMIGNAALATLDIAPVGFGMLGLYVLLRWIDEPGDWNAGALGAVFAAAILSKFSMLVFLLVMLGAVTCWQFWLSQRHAVLPKAALTRSHLNGMRMFVMAGLTVAWACYGFRLTALADPLPGQDGVLNLLAQAEIYPAFLKAVPLGLIQMIGFSNAGHPSYLLGETGAGGWLHYYLVGLAVRTPLPLLGLGLAGLTMTIVRSRRAGDSRIAVPALSFVAIMVFVSIASRINIGVRHILIVYPLLAIGAGYAVTRLLAQKPLRLPAAILVLVLAAGQFSSALYAHPDQMAYFNALAGNRPERILINADLDWGQDLDRLSAELQARDVKSLAIDYNGSADPAHHGLPDFTILEPGKPVTGWVAVSLFHRVWNRDGYAWLDKFQPVARVGSSIDLYFIGEPPK